MFYLGIYFAFSMMNAVYRPKFITCLINLKTIELGGKNYDASNEK